MTARGGAAQHQLTAYHVMRVGRLPLPPSHAPVTRPLTHEQAKGSHAKEGT